MAEAVDASAEFVRVLVSSPPRIAAATARRTPAQLRASPSAGEWSAAEILAHLRACADVWGGCMARILSEDLPTIRAVDPRTWIRSTDYTELAFQPSFEAFASQRRDLIASLELATPEAWTRSALVTGTGADREWDIHRYLRRMAIHERTHVKQIERIAASG